MARSGWGQGGGGGGGKEVTKVNSTGPGGGGCSFTLPSASTWAILFFGIAYTGRSW